MEAKYIFMKCHIPTTRFILSVYYISLTTPIILNSHISTNAKRLHLIFDILLYLFTFHHLYTYIYITASKP